MFLRNPKRSQRTETPSETGLECDPTFRNAAQYTDRLNCVSPGLTRSFSSRPIWEKKELLDKFTSTLPLQRIGEPDDIAGGVVFLASQAGSYVTGVTIPIDGGRTVLPPAAGGRSGDELENNLEKVFGKEHRFN